MTLIGISENRRQKTQETTTNFQLGEQMGGVLLYIRKAINYKPRSDLMIYKKRELEPVFIEIIQKDSRIW